MKHKSILFSFVYTLLLVAPNLDCKATEAPRTEPLKLNLLICLYNETDKRRVNEYIYCLEKNLKNPSIKQIHISYDTSRDLHKNGALHRWLQEHNLSVSYKSGRQTFGDCIRLANELFPDQCVVLSNADIWFDQTLCLLQERHIKGNLLAITKCRHSCYTSQDTWIFKTPFPEHPLLYQTYVGQLTCETPIIYVAEQNGLRACNPCRTIRCNHKHQSKIRHQSKFQHFGFIPLPFCTLDEVAKRRGAAVKKFPRHPNIPRSLVTKHYSDDRREP